MRIMALDYGSKTVGVALSDELLLTAQGHSIIRREAEKKLRKTLAEIAQIAADNGVTEIVLGYPKNMDGSEGDRCEKTREFQALVEKRTGLPVTLWDERLTTVAADRAMDEAGLRWDKKKEHVDRIAAELILRGFLDARAGKNT